MVDDEEQIRTLIERWAEAVHSGDMSGVLADHSDDIVMFDVPPPQEVFAASTPTVRRSRLVLILLHTRVCTLACAGEFAREPERYFASR
jgi:hypothetical protein